MPPAKKRARRPMSTTHKQALALGREQGRTVRRYLEALELHKPKRGRKRTPESIKKQLKDIDETVATAPPLTRVQLLQRRIDLERELEQKSQKIDLQALEDGFVEAAKDYGARKKISYGAWREAGVPPHVLRRAGITRGT